MKNQISLITGIVGLALTSLTWIATELDYIWRGYITLSMWLLIALFILLLLTLKQNKLNKENKNLKIKLDSLNNSIHLKKTRDLELGLLFDMNKAFDELKELDVKELNVLCYVGNYVHRELLRWSPVKLINLELKLIVRNPKMPWQHPPENSEQNKKRKINLDDIIDDLLSHQILKNTLNQEDSDNQLPICYYKEEPICRIVFAQLQNNSRRLYLGFYPLFQRNDVVDFTGTGRPVLKIKEESNISREQSICMDFKDWFDHIWKIRGNSSKFQKPLIAIDFDGVVADTNAIKSEWIKSELCKEVFPYDCNRSMCEAKIGKNYYNQLAEFAYSRNSTLNTSIVNGLEKVINDFSNYYDFIIITARNPKRMEFAEQWIEKNKLSKYFKNIVSSEKDILEEKLTKIEIAKSAGAIALIDDDTRHLDSTSTDILMIHFYPEHHKSKFLNIYSWEKLYSFFRNIFFISSNF